MTLNETNLEKRFQSVSTSQGSIQSLSFFCLHYKNHHAKIAQTWLRCLQKSEVPHRLTLIYLANDIVQNAKRKNTLAFIDDFKSILKDTVPYLKDDKIKKSVERVFSIWQDRAIYDSKFTNELKELLNNSGRSEPKGKSRGNNVVATAKCLKNPPCDLLECLNKLSNLEKVEDRLRSENDNIVDRIQSGNFIESDLNDSKTLDNLKEYIIHLKTDIDERSRLTKLLEDSTNHQRRLLKESEEQLSAYKTQLDLITKHRDDISTSQ